MSEQRDLETGVDAFKIGTKIRELREKNRYTYQDMTAKTGLSRELLSQIESDEAVPPVSVLVKLAKALNVGMAYFFQEEAAGGKIAVTRKDERVKMERRPHHHEGEVNYVYEALESKKSDKHMEPFLVEFNRMDTSDMVFMSHEGEEFLHLIEGKLEFRSVDRVEILEPGDSIYFESDVSHSFRCLSDEPARAFVVVWSRP